MMDGKMDDSKDDDNNMMTKGTQHCGKLIHDQLKRTLSGESKRV